MHAQWPWVWLHWPWHERVALLVGYRTGASVVIKRSIPVPNEAGNPRNDFGVTTSGMKKAKAWALANGMEIVGVVHSHPAGSSHTPSGADHVGLPEGWIGAVYVYDTGEIKWYANEEGAG